MEQIFKNNQRLLEKTAGPVFDATIRWCLSFNNKLSFITINEDTPCILRGMIEWHDLGKILENQEDCTIVHPGVVALEEKMVLLEDGIPCTLRQLQEGAIKARLSLEFSLPHSEQKVFRDSGWDDIDTLAIVDMVCSIQKKIKAGSIDDTTVISLACGRAKPSYFRQRSMKYKAALALARGVSIDAIPQNIVNHYVARDIINKKEYLVYGTRTRLCLHSGSGELVGHHISHLC
ncbi:hypothetical protein [Desulforhopalus sp. 52FAK]